MPATDKTQEFVVVMEPEYAADSADRAAKSRSMTISATDQHAAALVVARAFTGKNVKTLKNEGRHYRDPVGVTRYTMRRYGDGPFFDFVVALSPAEIQRTADAKAAQEAAYQATVDAAKPEQDAYDVLRAVHPGLRVSLSGGYVRVEWKAEFGVEGAAGYDYARVEVQKDEDNYRSEPDSSWQEPARVQIGNSTMKSPATQAAILIRAIRAAAAVAAMLDTIYPAGSATPTIPEGGNQIAASYRAHTALLARVVETIAAAQTGGAS